MDKRLLFLAGLLSFSASITILLVSNSENKDLAVGLTLLFSFIMFLESSCMDKNDDK
jgi:hypothetical protein